MSTLTTELQQRVDISVEDGTDPFERVLGPRGEFLRSFGVIPPNVFSLEDVLLHWSDLARAGFTDASQVEGWRDLLPGQVVFSVSLDR